MDSGDLFHQIVTLSNALCAKYPVEKAAIVPFPPPLSKLQSVKSSLLLNAALQVCIVKLKDIITGARHGERELIQRCEKNKGRKHKDELNKNT